MTEAPIYTPQAGTMPRKALLALDESETGSMYSVPLLEAIGQPPDYPSLSTILASCVEHKLVERDVINPRLSAWKITELGRKVAQGIKDTPDTPTRPRWTAHIPRVDVLPVLNEPPKESPAEPMGLDADAEMSIPGQAEGCEFALTSTGRLLIRIGTQLVALDKGQADALFAYTDEQRGVVWEAEE
jgi:hypothetical protein